MRNNVVKQKKPNVFAGIKSLTKWMVSKNRDVEEFQQLCKKFNFNKQIIKRIISYAYNSPHTIWFINKYMNDLYDWNNWEFEDIVQSIMYVFEQNQILSSQKFYYIKANNGKDINRQAIINIIAQFFKDVHDTYYSGQVLRFFYELTLIDEISMDEIFEADRMINNDKKTLRIKEENPVELWDKKINLPDISVADIKRAKEGRYPEEVQTFINDMKQIKENNDVCKKCKLFNKKIVILDTNIKNLKDPIDVMILGLNPSIEDVKMDQPFTSKGRLGMVIREQIEKFPEDTNWMITNSILCSSKNKTEIGSVNEIESIQENCSNLVSEIIKKFPAQLYILVGVDAAKSFDITAPITKISGEYYKDIRAIPVVHPSGAKNEKAKSAAERGWKAVQIKISENKSPTEKTNSDGVFLDVRELHNGKALMVYADENGKKSYKECDMSFKSFIKDSSYKDCSITTDKVDFEIDYDKNQRFKLSQELRLKHREMKKV